MKYKLGDLVNITSSKRIFYSEYKNNGIPFYRSKEIIEKTKNKNITNELFISNEKYKEIEVKYGVPKENDILMTAVGTLGVVWLVDKHKFYFKDGNLLWISNYDSKLSYKYLYYYFNTNEFKNIIDKICIGSTQKAITIQELKKIEIELPEKETQDKIIKILDAISNKITLNMHANNNLYEIGKALYKEYFENEKYTNNYEIKQLNEVTTNNRNKIDQTKEYKVLSAVNTGNLVLSDDYFDKQVYSKDIGKYLNVNKNDFAYNPARINIGSIGLNTFDFNCCVSPVYVTFSVDKDYIDFFDFYFKSKKFNAEVTLRASGSVRQALNYNDFGMIEIPYPTKEMIDKFNSSYKAIKERINKNKAKISNLEQIRDTLLPKLMNGEIDLDKIEI